MISLTNTDYINILVTVICLYIVTHKQHNIVKQFVDDKIIRSISLMSIYYISRKNTYIGMLLFISYFTILSHYSDSIFIESK